MDIDFLVERNGQFLVFETKPPNGDIYDRRFKGQRRALEALARIPQFTVAALYGEPDEPAFIQRCVSGAWRAKYELSNLELWNFCADWWLRKANGKKAS
jgi:hypothetical protein